MPRRGYYPQPTVDNDVPIYMGCRRCYCRTLWVLALALTAGGAATVLLEGGVTFGGQSGIFPKFDNLTAKIAFWSGVAGLGLLLTALLYSISFCYYRNIYKKRKKNKKLKERQEANVPMVETGYTTVGYDPGQQPLMQQGYQPGQYPPGQYLPGQYPLGQYPPGQYAPGQYPQGQYPQGQYIPGQYPPGQYPPGQYPPGQYPTGQYPPPPYPSAGFAHGQYPPGQYPAPQANEATAPSPTKDKDGFLNESQKFSV